MHPTRQAPGWLAEAETLVMNGRHKEAHTLCLAALEQRSDDPFAFYVLGLIANEHGGYAKASELLEKALAGADEARVHAQHARALSHLHRPNEARAAAERALAGDPKDAHTLDTIGVVLSRAGLHDMALVPFARAVAAAPDNASFHFNYAASLQFSGRFAEAETAYRRAFALDRNAFRALAAIAHLRRQNADDNLVGDLLDAFERANEDAGHRLHIGHALAKTFEDLGDYPKSLAWLTAAKSGVKQRAHKAAARDSALFEAAARTIGSPAAPGSGGDAIFVVGLPRTGTTLTERILSSHPDIRTAGELGDFGLLSKRAAATRSPFVLDPEALLAAAKLDLKAIGAAYLEGVEKRLGGRGRFVDKMPLNFFYAGLIHRALPEARIICLRRDPMDSCLSNYRQLLATGASSYDYTLDLETTAAYYAGFDRLAAHWRSHLPRERFTEVRYETLVGDIETEARRLIAFVGVAWDPRCIQFHENAAPVATASSVQVRTPLYATAIGRWRRYGDALAPLRAALQRAGVALED